MNRTLPKIIPLEEIKQLVQKRLALSEGWDEHTARLETWTSGKKIRHLAWKAQDQEREEYFRVSVDAASGEILDLDHVIPGAAMLKQHWCSREEAIAIAQKFIEQVYPDKARQVEPYAVHTQMDCYRLRYRRLANGIPFNPDGFEIAVEPVARLVRDLHLTWSDIDFAPRDNVISAEEAKKCFLEQFPLQLGYYVPAQLAIESMRLNEMDQLDVRLSPYLPDRGNPRQARLVYSPAYSSFYSSEPYWQIDALTGCLIDNFGAKMDAAAIHCNLLWPDQKASPRSLPSTGLSREEALGRSREIMDWLIGEYEIVQVKKTTWDFGDGSIEIWELRCVGELGEAHIRLDCGSGEVWFINSAFNDTPEGIATSSLEEMETGAHHLLELCLPHRAERMVSQEYALPRDYRKLIKAYTPPPGTKWSQAYTFMETINGLPVYNNLVTIILCGSTGRLQSFNRHRLAAGTTFPDPQTAIKPGAAARSYLDTFGLELAYTCTDWPDPGREQPATRLVYRIKPAVLPDFNFPAGRLFLDAGTGERLFNSMVSGG